MIQVKIIVASILIIFTIQVSYSQIGINETGNAPSSSAMLDITSSTKGLLIPRMSSNERLAIVMPANGLILYDTDQKSIFIFDSGKWQTVLNSIVVPTSNISIATGALENNNYGQRNIAIGFNALNSQSFTNGNLNFNSDNLAIGFEALKSNNPDLITTGIQNLAIGNESLKANSQGFQNTAVGHKALILNAIGNKNVALGFEALRDNNSHFNTAIGHGALKKNSSEENVAIGYSALTNTTTGNRNVGVGVASLLLNSSGRNNTAIGHLANYLNSMGEGNTSIGYFSHKSNTMGFYNVAIGSDADVGANNLTNSIAIGYQAIVNSSNKAIIGNASVIDVGGYGAWTNFSDKRLKENIVYDKRLGLDFILNLKTATYNYLADKNKRNRFGLIAQDVQEYLNLKKINFSGLIVDSDEKKTLNLSYPEFIMPLINAIQEQQLEIEILKEIINRNEESVN